MHNQFVILNTVNIIQDIPGSSNCVKFAPFHQNKNLPKGKCFTYLENPGTVYTFNGDQPSTEEP